MAKKKMTIDDLAVMVQKGFNAVDIKLDTITERVDGIDVRLGGIERRLDKIEFKLDKIIEARVERLEDKMLQVFVKLGMK